ncbi:MAG: FAD-binding protein [Rhodoferax sp.]|nr:FAD-binding protein [Rhodoferax sp.]
MHDVIVIGSGIGGLTAAGLLARVAGQRVLVLEQHTEPGGLTHVFRRDGASWDVGLHYIGEVEPGSRARKLFDYLSGGELRWNRMTDGFERFVYPGLDFVVPSDPIVYQQRLIDRFPDEKRAIRRYFRDIGRAVRWSVLGFMQGMVPKPVVPLLRLARNLLTGPAALTTAAYLNARFRSPELRALLASQWGDYGLPPSRSAFAMHAIIVHHYLHGAWFPQGGSARIARTFEKGIEAAGGSVRVAQQVTEIVVEGGRVVGVKVLDRRGPQPIERLHRAAAVISNVGVPVTFNRLLPTTGPVGAATAELRSLAQGLEGGSSAVTLYLRLKADPRTLGLQGENIWISTDLDHDDQTGQDRGLLAGSPHRIFVSFPSLKSGDERFHTAEIIGFANEQSFAIWRDQPKGHRGQAYGELKRRISEGLLKLAETALPGLTDLVSYSELATPLTIEHYTAHPGGRFYGLAATVERMQSPLLGPWTPLPGLFLSGSDAACAGIVGAMNGGVAAACQVLGARGYPMIQAALRTGPAAIGPDLLSPEKQLATLMNRQRLTPGIWSLEFEVEGETAPFAPGQFARLHVGDDEWRDYSIAGFRGGRLRLLISTRTGGHGSQFVQQLRPGDRTRVELPLGTYSLVPSPHRRVFVATGTGLAPFLPMFAALDTHGQLREARLLFGCRDGQDDLTVQLAGLPLPGDLTRCYSQAEAPPGGVRGRVTHALQAQAFDPANTDFYLCGSSAMVEDCRLLLERRGAQNIYVEAF